MNNRQIPVFMTVLLFISLAAASIYHAVRMVWVFFTPNMKFLGGAVGLFLILCFNIALLICLTAVKLYKPYLFLLLHFHLLLTVVFYFLIYF